MSTVCTTCPYCGVGCGVLATPDGQGGASIKGDPDHPANFGRLCSKGSALGETLETEGRLLTPQIGGISAGWDEALDLVAGKFASCIQEHGPDSVAFYVSGQFLTEDYYVANKLMKGYIGSANIDTNSRLCMASSVAGHKRAFGTDTVPGTYEDLEQADLIVLVGSNLAWCHPVLHQRIMAAKEKRALTIINIDPRRTATSDMADMHIGLTPGSDVTLFNGLLAYLEANAAVDTQYVATHVSGFAETITTARKATREAVAEACGLAPDQLEQFYAAFAQTKKVVTIYSQGVNQSSDGTDKVNAIINCHLATGRIGKPGMGPFSVTGQPNAMGGREVGGLANMLASHLDLENAAHRDMVQDFWNSPAMPVAAGLKAVDLFDACATGQIKALWVMCTNPAVSMPRADHVADAMKACDFVVVSDMMEDTDTTRLADVLLPATGWGEKDGTVTNSERRISRQRGFLSAPGQARHDWQIMCDVAKRMGFADGFSYAGPDEVFAEYAALTAKAERFNRDLKLSGLTGMDRADYDALSPVQWPVTARQTGGRMFADGRFHTPDGKARMLPLAPRPSRNQTNRKYDLLLNTGRVRDHWHTMTRTAKAPKLNQHIVEPYVEIHPLDAAARGLCVADLVVIESPHGEMVARAKITDRTPRGVVFAPMHWTGQWASKGRVDAVVAAEVDPVSGQPELKRTAVCLRNFQPSWYGFAVSRTKPERETGYWAMARTAHGWRIEMAGTDTPDDWEVRARRLLNVRDAQAISYTDAGHGQTRIAFSEGGRLVAALFVGPEPVAASRGYLSEALSDRKMSPQILAGRAGADRPDPGAIVCSCFNVGINTIVAAIEKQHLTSVDAIGKALQAGTNCGSCRPELLGILQNKIAKVAAE